MYIIVTNDVNWHREHLQLDRENTGNLKMIFDRVPCNKHIPCKNGLYIKQDWSCILPFYVLMLTVTADGDRLINNLYNQLMFRVFTYVKW